MEMEKLTKIITDNSILISLIAIGVVLLIFITSLFWAISLNNNEIRLRNQINAKLQERNAVFDNTWKIISQKAQVSDKYKKDFKDNFVSIMEARNEGSNGQLANFLVESNPAYGSKLYQEVSNSIEVQRNVFTRTQTELLDINREHLDLISTFPNSIVFSLTGASPIDVTIITSSKTEKVVESGKEDDIKVY